MIFESFLATLKKQMQTKICPLSSHYLAHHVTLYVCLLSCSGRSREGNIWRITKSGLKNNNDNNCIHVQYLLPISVVQHQMPKLLFNPVLFLGIDVFDKCTACSFGGVCILNFLYHSLNMFWNFYFGEQTQKQNCRIYFVAHQQWHSQGFPM